MAHEVFICYASRDKAVADAVCDALESKNIKCWIAPRDVLIGIQWAESIVDALDSSRVLVLVLSSSSNTSPQVIREVGRAAGNDIPIVPIRIDDVVPSKAMDYFVSSHHWLDAQTGPLEKHLQRLVSTVQQILTRRRTPQEVIEIQEAKERARREAEEAGKAKEAEERARSEEAARARQEAEEARRYREAEEKAKIEAEEARKAKEAEEKSKREAETAAKAARLVTYCPKCGVELRPNVSFCPKCGTRVSKAKKVKEVKERPPVFAEKFIKPLLKRRWLWAGAAAVLVALVLVLVFVLPPSETPTVSPPPTAEEEEVGGDWWNGVWGEEPEYGGQIVYSGGGEFTEFVTDPLDLWSLQFGPWLEALFTDDMQVDRDEFGFLINFIPLEYRACQLAVSWDQRDPATVVVRLHQGVVWKGGPAEGREFTSDDVVFTYDKILGVGEFAGENPYSFFSSKISSVKEVVAIDRYTVEFHLNTTHPLAIYEVLNPWISIPIVAREWYELTAEEQVDWHNVIGTGPFIIDDYVAGNFITYARNGDYYGIDARYGNKLPYADELKVLCIPDIDAALTALRTGQIDIMADVIIYPTLPATQQLAQTNPEINQFSWPTVGWGVFFHWDQGSGTITPPFDNGRVREAMQLAIDNTLIAETYYQGTVDGTPCGLMSPLAGDWSLPFDQWPPELQGEYIYNLEAAQALMAQAAVDGAFVPNALGGFDTEILASTSADLELLTILQAEFTDIGIDMELNIMNVMDLQTMAQQGNFELLWVNITGNTYLSPVDAIRSFYSQNSGAFGQGARASDPAYDAIVERFMAATTMSEAQAIFKEADMYWLENHWAVITFPSWSNQFHQPWIKGYMGELFFRSTIKKWTYFAHMWIDSDIRAQYHGE